MGLILFLLVASMVSSLVLANTTDTVEMREFSFVVAKVSGFLLVCWTVLLVFSKVV